MWLSWLSLESANRVADWANIIFIGSLVAGVLSTIAIVATANVKEWYWDKDRRESGEKIATLATQGDQLRKETAEANARTKEAELKLEQLRKLAGPRSLNHDVFVKELDGKPKSHVAIWYLPDSSDGWAFSFRLKVALFTAGWDAEEPAPIPSPPQNVFPWRNMPRAMVAGGQPSGITVVGNDLNMENPSFKALFEALAKSTDFGMYGSGGSQAMPVPEGTLRVVVAAKTDPMFIPGAAPKDDTPAK